MTEALESRLLLAVTRSWDGGGDDANWSNPLNWELGDVAPFPGDDLVFTADDPVVVNDYPAGTTFNALWVVESATITLTGNLVTLTSGLITGGGTNTSLNLPIRLANNQWFAGDGQSVRIAGGVDSNGHTLTLDRAASYEIASPITGGGALHLESSGGGFVEMAQTYTGGTVVRGGSWSLSTESGTPIGTGPLTVEGGVANVGGSVPGAVTVTGGALSATPVATLGSGFTLGAGGGLAVFVNGPDVGFTGYNRLDVAGPVNLGGGRLQFTNNFPGAAVGQTFVVISNDGTDPVQGQFAGLATGGVVSSNGGSFRINYAGGDGNDVTLTRVEGNPERVQFSTPVYSVDEGGVATVTVTRSGGTGAASATWATADFSARAGDDYVAAAGVLDFPEGVTQQTFTVQTIGDGRIGEGEEVFRVHLFAANNAAAGEPTTADVRITNAETDGFFALAEPRVTADEGAGAASVTVTRGAARTGAAQVTLAATGAAGGATAGEDFSAAPVTVSFASGESTKIVTLPITDDALPESDEAFTVQIQSVSGGAGISTQRSATVVIAANDSPGILAVANAEVRGHESTGTAEITVTRGGTGVGAVGFGYTLTPVFVEAQRPAGVATPVDDYDPASGTVTIPEGQTFVRFTVPVANDAIGEGDERFVVTLNNPTGGAVLASPETSQAAVIITDDDVSGIPPGPFAMGPDPAAPNELALFVQGTEGPDNLRFALRRRDGLLLAYVNRRLAGTFAQPSRIIVQALGGNDRISVGRPPIQLRVEGGDGDDVITGSNAGDVLIGGPGNDRLNGGGGRDLLFGGAGADRLIGAADDDVLVGGRTTLETDLLPGDLLRTVSANMLGQWSGGSDYGSRVGLVRADPFLRPGAAINDDARDVIAGGAGADLFFANPDRTSPTGDRVARPVVGEVLVSRADE